MSEEIVKLLNVERQKHSSLDHLLKKKGFYPSNDRGWDPLIKSWNKLTPTKPRAIELVFFRPSEEEWKSNTKESLPAYTQRKLRPASLFEILAAIPDETQREEQKQFCVELGKDFIIMIHGHYTTSWFSRGLPYIHGEYGWNLKFGTNILTSRKWCWYAGFRILKKKM